MTIYTVCQAFFGEKKAIYLIAFPEIEKKKKEKHRTAAKYE